MDKSRKIIDIVFKTIAKLSDEEIESIINKEGKLASAFAFGGENAQAMLLENEGIEVKDGFVDLSKYLWEP